MKNLATEKPVLCAGAVMADFIIPYSESKKYLAALAAGLNPERNTKIRLQLGGTSGNSAYGLSKLGVPAVIMAKVGRDYQGKLLRDDMANCGVDASCIFFDDDHPTMMNVVVSEDGNRSMFIWPEEGSSLWNILPEDIPPHLISNIGWAHFCGASSELNPSGDTLCDLAEKCRAAGVPVSVDLNLRTECFGWSDEHQRHLQRLIDASHVVFGSLKDEFPFFTPHPRDLVREDRWVISRDGKNGSTLYTQGGEYSVGIYDLKVADTVGAGDCFNSGFIAAAVAGLSPEKCLYWGNACGNWSVQFEGGHSGPDRETLLGFLEEKGVPKI